MRKVLLAPYADPSALAAALAACDADEFATAIRLCGENGMWEEPEGQWITEALMSEWGRRAPGDALAFCAKLGADWSADAAEIAVRSAAKVEFSWVEHSLSMPAYSVSNLLKTIWELSGADPATQGVKWIDSIRSEEHRDEAVATLGESWAARGTAEAEKAAGWLSGRLGEDVKNKRQFGRLAAGWVSADPAGAVEWVFSIGDTALRRQVAKTMVSEWSHTNPDQVSGFLEANKGHPDMELAVFTHVEAIAGTDPVSARRWAESLASADLREHALRAVVIGEHEAALARGEQSSLPLEKIFGSADPD